MTIGLRCQDAGARAIALHPRTRTQMYTGSARWEEIALLVDALDIPVIGNGDIKTAEDAVTHAAADGVRGVMIARGSFGQPWIFDQTRALLAGKPSRSAAHASAGSRSRSSTRAWCRSTRSIRAALRSSSASTSAGT